MKPLKYLSFSPKNKLRVWLLALLNTLIATTLLAEERVSEWQCLLPGAPSPRILEIIYDGPNDVPCQAFDRKGFSNKRIANYQNTSGQCERHVNQLVEVLEAGGYGCITPGARTYRVSGWHEAEQYSPYYYSFMHLEFEGDYVSGVLRPLLGDTTKPHRITGSYVDGHGIKIRILDDFGPSDFDYSEVVWELDGDIENGFNGSISLAPEPPGGFSQRDMTIYQTECGPHYRVIGLHYSFSNSRPPDLAKLAAAIDSQPLMFDTVVESFLFTGETDSRGDPEREFVERPLGEIVSNHYAFFAGSFEERKLMFERLDRANPTENAAVSYLIPDGMETKLVQAMRRTDLFGWVNLRMGVCGIVDSNAFVFPAASTFLASLDELAFITAFGNQLEDHFRRSSNGYGYRVGRAEYDLFDDAPMSGVAVFPVAATSEAVRDEPGNWDSFDATIRFSLNGNMELRVELWADDAKTVRRGGSTDVPPSSFFRTDLAREERRIADVITLQLLAWCKDVSSTTLDDHCRVTR